MRALRRLSALLVCLALAACTPHASAPPAVPSTGGPGGFEGVDALGPGGGAIRYPATAAAVPDPLPVSTATLTQGRETYAEYCEVCHGVNLDGRGPGGANLSPRPADLTAPHLRNLAAGQIYWIVTNGLRGSGMPPWGEVLSTNQRWAVTQFVQQNPRPEPGADPQWTPPSNPAVDTTIGHTLFTDDCAVCHGIDGRGMGPAGRWLAPRPADLTAPYIAAYSGAQLSQILVQGIPGTPMPAWRGLLSAQQRGDIVAYLRGLQSEGG